MLIKNDRNFKINVLPTCAKAPATPPAIVLLYNLEETEALGGSGKSDLSESLNVKLRACVGMYLKIS